MNMLYPGDATVTDARPPLASPPSDERRGWDRLRRVPRSILACIVAPTLLAALYYGLIASGQYVAEARFAVRSSEPVVSDLLGTLTGIPGQGGSSQDSYAVRDYILSREGIVAISQHLDVRAMFGRDGTDWLSRLGADAPIEDVVEYWAQMIDVIFEPTTGISTLRVRAFTPEDAQALAAALLAEGELLVNRLSERARRDALSFAEAEVERAEQRLTEARRQLTEFRNQRQMLDPARAAEGRLGLVASLEGEVSRAQAELSALRSYMHASASPIVSLESRIVALKDQIRVEERKLASRQTNGSELMSTVVADYERVSGEHGFAERAYLSALTGLEAARAEALRQSRYLVSFVQPRLPEDATRPRRLLAIATVFCAACVVWALGALGLAAIKDHSGWV